MVEEARPKQIRSWLTEEETEDVIEYIGELGNHSFLLSHHRLKEHVDQNFADLAQ